MSSRLAKVGVVSLLFAALACGGGGGGGGSGSDAIRISFTPGTLTTRFNQGNWPTLLPITATLSKLPTRSVYALLVEDAEVLATTDVTVSQDSNSFTTSLTPACMLSPGSHTGVLTLKLCYDAACDEPVPLSGNQLPYDFTIDPGLLVSAEIDGVAQPGYGTACEWFRLTVKAGQDVRLVSTVPVSWSDSIGGMSGMPSVEGLTTTDTTWEGTVACFYGSLLSGTALGGVTVTPTPLSGELPFPDNVIMDVVAP